MENQKCPIYGIESISLMEIELSDVIGELHWLPKSEEEKKDDQKEQGH